MTGLPPIRRSGLLRFGDGRSSAEEEFASGQDVQTVEVADREHAIAIAHHLLDKHAHEAFGTMSLEIHVVPPQQPPSDKEPSGFRHYKVSAEARKQAQTLGIRGDVEAKVARRARRRCFRKFCARPSEPMSRAH